MYGNTQVTPGYGAKIAVDIIDGVQYQRFKPSFGPEGQADDVSITNPLPVSVVETALAPGAPTAANQQQEIGQLSAILAALAELQSITGATAITASDSVTVTAGRSFVANCTVAGNVKVGFSGGSTLTIVVAIGTLILPWAVVQVFVTGTTATATYANLS